MATDGTRHLVLAIVAQAIRDLENTDTAVRTEAQQWLAADPLCETICEFLGYDLSTLHRAVGIKLPQADPHS